MDSPRKNRVYILIGPKGSGKSYIGNFIERHFEIKFLRVERLLIEHIEQKGLKDCELERDGFDIEEEAISKILQSEDSVVTEATGSSVFLAEFLERLRTDYEVKLIRVSCPLDICASRIRNRNGKDQFYVSDESVRSINEKSAKLQLNWNLDIDNSGPATHASIVEKFSSVI